MSKFQILYHSLVENVQAIQAVHISSKVIPIGSIIISNQEHAASFDMFYRIYDKVAKKMGVKYWRQYGYAYRKDHPNISHFGVSSHLYVVESDDVTKGDFRHSIYAQMESGVASFRRYPNAQTLEEKKLIRDAAIEKEAIAYFSVDNSKFEELISPSWKVVDKLR